MRYGSLSLTLLLACGCGSSSDPSSRTPAALTVLSGGAQRGEVGKELPDAVVVRVVDANGAAVPNQIINFVVVSGDGSVFGGTAETNAQGEARERWTLGTVAGEQVLEGRAVDQSTGEALVLGRITAIADPGPAASLSIFSRFHTFLGLQLDLNSLVTATDQYGNSVTDLPLTLGAEPPFQVDGTKISSVTEVKGSVTVTSGALSASTTVTVLRDLHELVGAQGSWACEGRSLFFAGPPEGTLIATHVSTTFVVDSVGYLGTARFFEVQVVLYGTGTSITTLEDGTTRTRPAGGAAGEQAVGNIHWDYPVGVGSAVVTSEAPLSYVGGHFCADWTLDSFEPITITR